MKGSSRKPLVILTGPTAVGKSELSVGLARAIGGEIISADSMQVYRGMDIGTAKITRDQMQGVPHYLIDELDPWEEFNVVLFQQRCKAYMEDIYRRNKIPVLVGGTGFYIQSVLYDIDFTENDSDTAYRRELEERARLQGSRALHQELARIDRASADAIHPNNTRRIIRALEYYRQTGEKMSEHNETQRQKESPFVFLYYVLSLPRDVLYDRINRRVDQMREQGLVEEVKRLREHGCTREMASMQGLGYKEILAALDGETTMDEAFETIKRETRHFAKRQFTWFRRERDVTWLPKESFADGETLLEHCREEICQKLLGGRGL